LRRDLPLEIPKISKNGPVFCTKGGAKRLWKTFCQDRLLFAFPASYS